MPDCLSGIAPTLLFRALRVTSFRGFSFRAQLSRHNKELVPINETQSKANAHGSDLKNHFPTVGVLIGTAYMSLFLLGWRWWNLRTERQVSFGGYWSFAAGCILWGRSTSALLMHWRLGL